MGWGQRSCRGQPGSAISQIAYESPIATPDQNATHCWVEGWVEGHVKVVCGQPEVKLLRNAQWPFGTNKT